MAISADTVLPRGAVEVNKVTSVLRNIPCFWFSTMPFISKTAFRGRFYYYLNLQRTKPSLTEGGNLHKARSCSFKVAFLWPLRLRGWSWQVYSSSFLPFPHPTNAPLLWSKAQNHASQKRLTSPAIGMTSAHLLKSLGWRAGPITSH